MIKPIELFPLNYYQLNIVDVRDVADLHIRAMTNPKANGGRFIASADGQISMPKIAALIKNKKLDIVKKFSVIGKYCAEICIEY